MLVFELLLELTLQLDLELLNDKEPPTAISSLILFDCELLAGFFNFVLLVASKWLRVFV
jgi:hypothetical protein